MTDAVRRVISASILNAVMRAAAIVLGLCAVVFAACASGGSGTVGPSDDPAHCGLLNGARQTIDYHLSLLLTLDDPEAQQEVLGQGAPFRIDPDAFRAAVEALSVLTGAESEVGRLRRIAQLLEEHAGVADPFAPGSDTGRQLADLADQAFGEVQVGLDAALRAAGCPVR
ncbi:MAG: hypothetical protein H0V04_03870 [Chloroflexi bacterium]|nr:hypothetical protein [Chloroflexota bacterium]